jgi:hypothetical protein
MSRALLVVGIVVSHMTSVARGPLNVRSVADAVVGSPDGVRLVDGLDLPGGAGMARVNGDWRVYVSGSLPLRARTFVALRELADYTLDEMRIDVTNDERVAVLGIAARILTDLCHRQDDDGPPSRLRLASVSCVA